MALVTIEEVRKFGKLPSTEKLPDADIEPQLEAAARKLVRWIGEYESSTDAGQISDYKEAESCLCMANLQQNEHTFYVEGLTTLLNDLGDKEGVLVSPADRQMIIKYWTDRAKEIMQRYIDAPGAKSRIGFYAI